MLPLYHSPTLMASSSSSSSSSLATATIAVGGKRMDGSAVFDMGSLKNHLPLKRRGLSNYFSGESRSFACLGDAKSLDDLRKADIPEAKRRKYSDRQEIAAAATKFFPPVSCRTEKNSNSSYCRSSVGV